MGHDPSPALIYVIFQSPSLANGGLESATQLVARLPFAPIIVTHRESSYTDRWRKLGSIVHVWPLRGAVQPGALSRIRRAPGLATFNLRLAALVRRFRAPIVQCNDIAALWHAAPGARLGGAPVVFNVRDIFPEDRMYGPRWRSVHHLADEVVCLSEEMRRTVLARFPPLFATVPRAKLSVTYSAVDLDRMRPLDPGQREQLRNELGMADRFEIAYVGTVCEKKGQLEFLTQALPRLVERLSHVRVSFVGDFNPATDPYAASCEETVESLGLARFARFTGFDARPERYYQAADLVCLTSKYEGLPRAMIESMACGTPIVAFDVTSAREFLELHRCGRVATRGDWPALVDAVVECATDPEVREQMSRNGRQTAERFFSPAAAVAAYLERYRALQPSW